MIDLICEIFSLLCFNVHQKGNPNRIQGSSNKQLKAIYFHKTVLQTLFVDKLTVFVKDIAMVRIQFRELSLEDWVKTWFK